MLAVNERRSPAESTNGNSPIVYAAGASGTAANGSSISGMSTLSLPSIGSTARQRVRPASTGENTTPGAGRQRPVEQRLARASGPRPRSPRARMRLRVAHARPDGTTPHITAASPARRAGSAEAWHTG